MTTSNAIQRRIAAHLAAGVTPSVRGNRVVLQDVVLVRATGDRAPAAAEAERQSEELGINLKMSFWDNERATTYRGNSVIAYDQSGLGHTVSRRVTRAGERQQVATRAGRRFYRESAQTEWIMHLPVRGVREPQNTIFNRHFINITSNAMDEMFLPGAPEERLIGLNRTRAGADQRAQVNDMAREWNIVFPPERAIPYWWVYPSEAPQGVHVEIDPDLSLIHI